VTASEVLDLGLSKDETERARGSIRRAAGQMHRLVDDLLEVTQIEGSGVSLKFERVDAASLISEVASAHSLTAEDRSIRLVETAPEGLGLEADRSKLSQALSNIVGNALKFTQGGGEVRLSAACADEVVRVIVSDNGPGISADHLPHLFDRFWRASQANRDGVGLGLAIAKGIVEAHRGHIEVESELGRGSRFTLVLPAASVRT
jgi:signal transduction histidine kinase